MTQRSNSFPFFLVVVLLFFSAIVSCFPGPNRIALYGAIPLAFVLSVLNTDRCLFKIIANNVYTRLLFLLYCWISFTSLYATYQAEASREMHEILGVILLITIFCLNASNPKRLKWLYAVYIIYYLGLLLYARYHIIPSITIGEDRLNDEELNANTLAYFTFYVSFAIFILAQLTKKHSLSIIFRIAFLMMIPVSFYIAILTASRQVLIIQIPLFLMLLSIRYLIYNKSIRLVFILSVILIAAFSLNSIRSVYENSYLMERNSFSLEEDSRLLLLKDSFNVGKQHFFTGVGAGNYIRYSYNSHISHCSFTELFANTGVFGAIIYVIVLLRATWLQIKRYNSTKDPQYLVFLSFFLIYILDNVFFVFYNNLWLMGFLILVLTHSESYWNTHSPVCI